ncbi:nucleotidyltransferase family protein [Kineococcus xinjiangensis]|uniref:nucleotidyltransferase family protein n=1 Tax=Kineococcus xinjiangensis TaxID=512762 RepID=UPI001304DB1B|nr:nucleotidyltransferase domain-containing protein [Kineococcus xinjiangensis]
MDGPVLAVLAGTTTPLAGREVARLVSTGSRPGVQRVLKRLTAEGVVRAERRSNAVYYTGNRDHLAWPAVELLTRLRTELLHRLTTHLEHWSVRPVTAAVFGSLARGDGSAESDIDLLLVRGEGIAPERLLAWEQHVETLVATAHAWTGNPVQPYDISLAELRQHVVAGEPIVASWRREALTLTGRNLGSLLRSLAR